MRDLVQQQQNGSRGAAGVLKRALEDSGVIDLGAQLSPIIPTINQLPSGRLTVETLVAAHGKDELDGNIFEHETTTEWSSSGHLLHGGDARILRTIAC